MANKVLPFWMDEFQESIKETEKIILKTVNCDGRAIFLMSTTSGAMDSAVLNFIGEKDKVMIINGGMFGERWKEICEFYKLKIIEFKTGYGKNINIVELENKIIEEKPKFILMQAVETSSGQKFDINRVGDICRKKKIKLFVDAISAFLGDNLDMKEMKIDLMIINPRKGLGMNPCVAIVLLRRGMTQEKLKRRNYYFDYGIYNKEFMVPFSVNTEFLCEVNKKLKEEDPQKRINQANRLAKHFRELIKNLPVEIVAENHSNSYTAIRIKEDADKIMKEICKEKIYFYPYTGNGENVIVIPHSLNNIGGPRGEYENIKLWRELKRWIS